MNEDYCREIKFKCGLEIHNRLKGKKLFCSCPAVFSEKGFVRINRKLRPVVGETNKIDVAAQFEFLKNREFVYRVFSDASCLVEMDEEPPHKVNKDALYAGIQIAKMLKADIPQEIHVMRKTVIDGSNTSGFQRTMLVGLNGVLETSLGVVRISNICLEEESAGIIKKSEKMAEYRLDRLGMPLIEIGTEPDIKTPEHAKEVAEKIGMIIRSTGRSQRGIGTIRQDINISINNGPRVELKGVQDIDLLPKIIENEIKRQLAGNVKEETRVTNPDGTSSYTRPLPGAERMYPETDVPAILIEDEFLKSVKIPETLEEKLMKLKKVLPEEIAVQILKSEYLSVFEKIDYEPVVVANTFVSVLKSLRRDGFEIDKINDEDFVFLFDSIKKGKLSKEAIPAVLENVCKGLTMAEAIEKTGGIVSDSELRKIIEDVIKKNRKLAEEKRVSALMGDIMKIVRGRADGKKVAKILNEMLKGK